MSDTLRVSEDGPGPPERGERLGRFPTAFFAVVVVAAGASGVALLVAPGSTERYFSWTLRPRAAAALIGGFYLASAVVFGWGLTLRWREARTLVVGVLGLAVPTLVLTIVHDEVFDFGRWQALAWVALFVAAPVSAAAMLARTQAAPAPAPALPAGCRAALAVLGALLLAVAVAIWTDGTREAVMRASPVELIRLTGTYLGAWCSFLAVLCGFAAIAGQWAEGRVALVALGVASLGAGLAMLRVAGDLRHPLPAIAAAALLAGLAAALYAAARPRP